MTGTAQTEAGEFNKVYKVGVVSIPTHRPMIRIDQPGRHLQDREGQVQRGHRGHRRAARHRPAGAGRHGLGGELRDPLAAAAPPRHPAQRAEREVPRPGGGDHRAGRPQGRRHGRHQHGRPRHRHPARRQPRVPRRGRAAPARPRPDGGPEDDYAKALEEILPTWKEACDAEADEVIAAGGLYVLGTERHESRRIDNQLRGRSGRQGDPGESRFYLSLQDDLMRRFRAGAVEAVMERFNIPEDVPIESKMVTRQIQQRADPDRGPERRDPQERPQVRRGPEQAAPGRSTPSASACSTARTCTTRSGT